MPSQKEFLNWIKKIEVMGQVYNCEVIVIAEPVPDQSSLVKTNINQQQT